MTARRDVWSRTTSERAIDSEVRALNAANKLAEPETSKRRSSAGDRECGSSAFLPRTLPLSWNRQGEAAPAASPKTPGQNRVCSELPTERYKKKRDGTWASKRLMLAR